jgi:transcriptional regulator with XRE-family HTH domain
MGLAADVLSAARLRAGLTQRELAERAGTSQSTVNRYEKGAVEPSLATLQRLVEACGLELRISLAEPDGHDEQLARLMLALSPAERLAAQQAWERLRSEAQRVS